jgi:hypothetical protein
MDQLKIRARTSSIEVLQTSLLKLLLMIFVPEDMLAALQDSECKRMRIIVAEYCGWEQGSCEDWTLLEQVMV